MIEKHKDLIRMIDARKAIPPSLEPLVVRAYEEVFGRDENFEGWVKCKCPSYVKLFYTELKKQLLIYERRI
jgi:hypothetical protein